MSHFCVRVKTDRCIPIRSGIRPCIFVKSIASSLLFQEIGHEMFKSSLREEEAYFRRKPCQSETGNNNRTALKMIDFSSPLNRARKMRDQIQDKMVAKIWNSQLYELSEKGVRKRANSKR